MRNWEINLGLSLGGAVRAIVCRRRARGGVDAADRRSSARPLVLALAVVLGVTLFSSLGVVVGIYAKTWDHAGFVQNIVIVPLSFLGGVFYAVTRLPSPWRELSHANPIFYLVQAFRYGFLGSSDIPGRPRARRNRRADGGHRRLERLAFFERPQAEALRATARSAGECGDHRRSHRRRASVATTPRAREQQRDGGRREQRELPVLVQSARERIAAPRIAPIAPAPAPSRNARA